MLDARQAFRSCVIAMIVAAFAGCCVTLAALGKEASVDELKAHLSSTPIGDRPHLCLQIAERQLALSDKLYAATENEQARVLLADVIAFSELARDYSIQSHKHQKQTEISVRGMAHKLIDLKHAIPHDEQTPVQNAIDRLQRVRDDLLFAMFPKGKGDK
jgi:hypothetical protein